MKDGICDSLIVKWDIRWRSRVRGREFQHGARSVVYCLTVELAGLKNGSGVTRDKESWGNDIKLYLSVNYLINKFIEACIVTIITMCVWRTA